MYSWHKSVGSGVFRRGGGVDKGVDCPEERFLGANEFH